MQMQNLQLQLLYLLCRAMQPQSVSFTAAAREKGSLDGGPKIAKGNPASFGLELSTEERQFVNRSGAKFVQTREVHQDTAVIDQGISERREICAEVTRIILLGPIRRLEDDLDHARIA